MGVMTRKSLSVLLALSLVLSLLGTAALQLIGAGTAYAATRLGTNLVYENVYGLMQPSGSEYAYAIMWNDGAVGEWSDEKNQYEGGVGYSLVRSDGTTTMHIDQNQVLYGTGNAFYRWDGLIPLADGVFTLEGKRVVSPQSAYVYQNCSLATEELSIACYYDEVTKLLISWEGDDLVVHKKDGAVVQTIPLPKVAANAKSGSLWLSHGKDKQGPVVALELDYRYDGISKEGLEAIAVPDSGWGVEITSDWDPDNPRDWRTDGEPEIWDDDLEKWVSNPDYDASDGNGSIRIRYGLRYNNASGGYEKVKLSDFEDDWDGDTNQDVAQDMWVDAGDGNYSAFKQPAMSSGVVPYRLESYDRSTKKTRVTTAADVSGTPLFVAGYAIGAQNLPDSDGTGLIGASMHLYPQNPATGLYFAYKNGKYGVINQRGAIAIPFEYDAFCNNTFSKTSFALMKKGSAWEFVDLAQAKASLSTSPGAPASSTAPKAQSIAKAKVTVGSKVYTGKTLKPTAVTVKLNGKKLKKGTDYTISCAGGKKIGSYKVTVKGKGAYTGTVASTFLIVPKATALKRVTAAKKGFTATWKKLSKTHLKQITGYQVRYCTSKSFKKGVVTKTVKGSSKLSLKVRKLKAKKTYYVQIRSYRKVGSVKYYSAWSKTLKVKTKAK